jgi:hypothetical protein
MDTKTREPGKPEELKAMQEKILSNLKTHN